MKFFKTLLVAFAIIFSISSSVYADALDNCVNILMNGTYTIRYVNVTPPTREAMHEKMYMFDGNMLEISNPYTMYQPVAGIVAAQGNNRYVEITSPMNQQNVAITKAVVKSMGFMGGLFGNFDEPLESEYATCSLTKNNERFIFTRIKNEKKTEYVGTKKGKVEAILVKKGFKTGYAYDFGDNDVTKVLNAILPNDKKLDGMITYKRVGSGTLSNGQYYVDVRAEKLAENTIFDAIRYYFEGGNLVKIEAGQYYRTQGGKLDGTRMIINVLEFSDSTDSKYFKLPSGLQDVTKRDTSAKGAGKK